MGNKYTLPAAAPRPKAKEKTVYLVASGDLREPANISGWAVQAELEANLADAFAEAGWTVERAHPVDEAKGHGFISSQAMGIDVFKNIPPEAPLVVAEAVWQYSHHVLPGLRTHNGPILTAANFSGTAPGLVGMLNLNGGLTKAQKPYSTIWSVDFTDKWARDRIKEWLETGHIKHDTSHVHPLPENLPADEAALGAAIAAQLREDKAIVAVFDEGCMGMYNAIIDDELLNPTGIFKERLSQSALYAEMMRTSDAEAQEVRDWLDDAGLVFRTGTDEATELTDAQILMQCKMYIAALRIADDFGADAVGIQYQQGLKDLVPASDLVEGLLNNVSRPPVKSRDGSRILYENKALPHFNEVDEGVAVDALITNRVWNAMGLDPATTLHDVRWGDDFDGEFVWVYEISGAVPASHFADGYKSADSWRQNPMYFPAGGGTLRGVSKPGDIVWSRVFIEDGVLKADLGVGKAVELPAEETQRRWEATDEQWPIMHAVLPGISRDQFMGRHKANHVQVVYAPDPETAARAMAAKAATFAEMGLEVAICGDVEIPED
jgi:L-fucose isomerase, C-terminal domain.